MTKLIHYSPHSIEKLENRDYENSINTKIFYSWSKPHGLWISIEDGDGWKDWCLVEKFRLENLTYKYEIELNENSEILYLKTIEDIHSFTKKYTWNPIEEFSKLVNIPLPEGYTKTLEWGKAIRWFEVTKKYQGIIIAPYQWECRLNNSCMWYYGWDCSSGCIWDISAIKGFKLICDKPVVEQSELIGIEND